MAGALAPPRPAAVKAEAGGDVSMGTKAGGPKRRPRAEAPAAGAGGGLQFSKTLDYKSCDHILCLVRLQCLHQGGS